MKIVIIGAGGVGGYFGGRLIEAGKDVTLIARGAHYEAIQLRGLEVKSIKGDFKVTPKISNNLSPVEQADLVILAVKSWQIDALAQGFKALLKPDATVLPLQNGADNADRLRAILPEQTVLAGLCKIVSRIEKAGVIDHFAYEPEIVFGEYDNRRSDRGKAIDKLLTSAGIKSTISDDIHLDIWKKFLFIATISGMGAITRAVFGVMRENEHIRQLLYQTANEIVAVANAKGIGLTNDDVELIFKIFDNLNYNTTASMQRDIMSGRPSELEIFNGYIVAEGRRLHVSTPVNAFTFHCLWPQEQKARKPL